MGTLSEILERAQQRAKETGLAYEGVLTPEEAWQVLQQAPSAVLVDVRSRAELDLVGRIPQARHIEWAFYPEWKPNQDFAAQLGQQVDKESLVIFMCRSGARSDKAANLAHAAGYTSVYNLLNGFEGDANAETGQRSTVNGWKVAKLPWTNA
jgi:rhodanese-related sulfurtransferase